MNIVIALVALVILLGALAGGNSFGDTIRRGVSVTERVIWFIAIFLFMFMLFSFFVGIANSVTSSWIFYSIGVILIFVNIIPDLGNPPIFYRIKKKRKKIRKSQKKKKDVEPEYYFTFADHLYEVSEFILLFWLLAGLITSHSYIFIFQLVISIILSVAHYNKGFETAIEKENYKFFRVLNFLFLLLIVLVLVNEYLMHFDLSNPLSLFLKELFYE